MCRKKEIVETKDYKFLLILLMHRLRILFRAQQEKIEKTINVRGPIINCTSFLM